jgi:carbamate kinase
MKIVIALGGNALQKPGSQDFNTYKTTVAQTAHQLAGLIISGHRLTITHGNGPQVGDIFLQQEISAKQVTPRPLYVCGAESQGQIGYMLQSALQCELAKRGSSVPVVTVISQVVVDKNDPAFKNPTKPIGAFYSPRSVPKLKTKGWVLSKTDKKYRRVVPSPRPLEIVEVDAINTLMETCVVITCGGGGIPVIREDDELIGVEGVIDKDLCGALLAIKLNVDLFMILTDVDGVYLNYGKPDAKKLDVLTISDANRFLSEEQFPPGSMGPKIEACIQFVQETRRTAVIASLENVVSASEGVAGTTILLG